MSQLFPSKLLDKHKMLKVKILYRILKGKFSKNSKRMKIVYNRMRKYNKMIYKKGKKLRSRIIKIKIKIHFKKKKLTKKK